MNDVFFRIEEELSFDDRSKLPIRGSFGVLFDFYFISLTFYQY